MSSQSFIEKLLSRILFKKLSDEEQDAINTWVDGSFDNAEVIDVQEDDHKQDETPPFDWKKLAIQSSLNWLRDKSLKFDVPLNVLMFVLVWIFVFRTGHPVDGRLHLDRDILPVGEVLKPSCDHPCIHPSNGKGKAVLLDKLKIGESAKTDGWMISKTGDRAITYTRLTGPGGTNIAAAPSFHLLCIPFGTSWSVTLPDRTVVQVNSGSGLAYWVNTYPDLPPQRVVALYGEAYFNVAPDARMPFAVKTTTGVIDVLGTQFNLREYSRLDDFCATLVSGKIALDYRDTFWIMRPGQEARIDKIAMHKCVIRAADTTAALAWRRPNFEFEKMNLSQAMQQIKDWYGLKEYIFDDNVDTATPGLLGTGRCSKEDKVQQLLRGLEASTHLRLTLKGKVIYVSNK